MKISWPFCAEISEAALVLSSVRLILSTITLVLFFSPHCLVKVLLNHVSQAGTKWLHWQIFKVFCCAAALPGNKKNGPLAAPRAMAPLPLHLMKSRREKPLFLLLAMSVLLSNPSEIP